MTRRYGLHARLLWRSAPGGSLICVVLTVTQAAAGTAALVTTGRLVGSLPAAVHGGLGSAAAERSLFWLVATAIVFVAGPVAGALAGMAGRIVSARYLVTLFDMTMEAGVRPYGISRLEDPRSAGQFDALAEEINSWLIVQGVESTWEVLATRLAGAGSFVVLAAWRWWAPLVAATGWVVMSRASTRYLNSVWDTSLDTAGTDKRRASYLRTMLSSASTAKEVRLFGLAGWLLDRYTTTWQAAMSQIWRRRRHDLRVSLLTVGVGLVTTGTVFAVLAVDAWNGAVSAGVVVTSVQAILGLAAFGMIGDSQTFMTRTTAAVAKLAGLRLEYDLPELPAPSTGSPSAAVPTASGPNHDRAPARVTAAAVDLDDVCFTYPARQEPTLAGVRLHIPAGQSVAIVGVNGAGKSTLIKLLCGLYRPDSGTVCIDGDDPGTVEAVRRRVAVIFQDFVHYPLPLRDNVGFGAVTLADDQAVLSRALADAGGQSLLERLEDGWDTVLSPDYEGGTDLSGGQWQRVALARALAALEAGAGLLILDEPTAALDVRAEAALFERFLQVTRGATTILVSHRLSSVRHADRIIVLGDTGDGAARVIEDGSHDQLLAANGTYAHLFRLQAARFAAAGANASIEAPDGGQQP